MLKKETKHVKNKFYESNKLSARMSEEIRFYSNIKPTAEAQGNDVHDEKMERLKKMEDNINLLDEIRDEISMTRGNQKHKKPRV